MKRALPGILLLAVLLRWLGIQFECFHPDERSVYRFARAVAFEGQFEPEKMNYGTLTAYTQAVALWFVNAIHQLLGSDKPLSSGASLLVARFVSMVSSSATVYLVYRIARKLRTAPQSDEREESAALLAAGVMAVSFLSVQCGHYSTVDSLLTLLTTLAVGFALRASRTAAHRDFMLAGMAVGLAAACKYTGVLSAVPLLVLLLWNRTYATALQVVLAGTTSAATFLIAMPYALLRMDKLIIALQYEQEHYRDGLDTVFAVGDHTWLWNLQYLFYTGVGPALLLAAVGGLVLMLQTEPSDQTRQSRLEVLQLMSYPVLVYLFTARYPTRFDRTSCR